MLVRCIQVPTRYQEGQILDSLQSRRVIGQSHAVTVPVGCTLPVPDQHVKVMISERYGGIWIDRFFLGIKTSRKQFPSVLIPIYLKIYEGEHASVILALNGIRHISRFLTGKTRVIPLQKIILEMIGKEVDPREEVSAIIKEYIADHSDDVATDLQVDGLISLTNPLAAGYPWDLGNMAIPDMLLVRLRSNEQRPSILLNQFGDVYMDYQVFRNPNLMVREELEEVFTPNLGPTMSKQGIDKNTQTFLERPIVRFRDLKLGGPSRYPTLSSVLINSPSAYTPVTKLSSELQAFCVAIQQSPFAELTFRTILPHQNRIAKFNLIQASARTATGVDLEVFQMEMHQLLSLWDCEKYEALAVHKSAEDELFIELTGVDPQDTVRFYVDLFYLTLTSQALVHLD